MAEQRVRSASKEDAVKSVRNEARRSLKEAGYLDKFASKPLSSKTGKKQKGAAKQSGRDARNFTGSIHGLSPEEFQAAVGRIIPRLKRAKLDDEQIEEVLKIIRELVTS